MKDIIAKPILGALFLLLGLSAEMQAQLSLSYSEDNPAFCGISDGAITLTATGGLAPYRYSFDGGAFGNNSTFGGLAAGYYLGQVVDANFDTAFVDILLSNPDGPGGTILNQTDPTCTGGNDGRFSVAGPAGQGPYTYSLDGITFQPTGLFQSLTAGNYAAHIRDSLGCVSLVTLELLDPSPVDLMVVSKTDVDCNGESTAFFTVQGQGGTAGGYQFSLDGGMLQSLGTFTGLGAGNYEVRVVDNNGCEDSLDLSITEPAVLQAQIDSLVPVPCFGDSTGQVTVRANGGVSPYLYALGGYPLQSDSLFTNVPADTHLLQIQDANGCLASRSIVVNQPDPVELSLLSTTDPLCNGDSNGQAVFVGQGGTGVLTFIWPNGQNTTGQITDLSAGEFPVILVDEQGCQSMDTLRMTQPAVLEVDLVGIDPACNNTTDGILRAEVTGGTPSYSYTWSHDNLADSAVLTDLPSGFYDVQVADTNGCMAVDSVFLDRPLPILADARIEQDTCLIGKGRVVLRASGGVGGFNYLWNVNPQLDDSVLSGLSPGFYQGIAFDANGCSDTVLVEVEGIEAPSLVLDSLRPVSCAGDSDGYLAVAVSGGTAPYNYRWSDDTLNTAQRLGLSPGNYAVIVEDQFCRDTLQATINAPTPLETRLDSVLPPACEFPNSGFLAVSARGGTMPYRFQWSHDPNLTDGIATSLVEGDYLVIGQDANGCTDSLELPLYNPRRFDLALQPRQIQCAGENSGSIVIVASGGIAPYTYQWNHGPDTPKVENLAAGWYQVAVTDQSGCTLRDSAEITEPVPLDLQVDIDAAQCADSANGQMVAFMQGGVLPYQYYWSSGDLDSVAESLLPGEYLLQVRDRRGCLVDTFLTVPGPPSLEIEVIDVQDATCGELIGRIEVNVTGGTPGYDYNWNTPLPVEGPVAEGLAGGLPSRRYRVLVTDEAGCQAEVAVDLKDSQPADSEIITSFDPEQPQLLSQARFGFQNASDLAVAHQWRINGEVVSVEREFSFRFSRPGIQEVMLIAFDEQFACPVTDTLLFEILADGSVYTPNAFTPNGDGKNDFFRLQAEGVISFEQWIFNQWGRLVFQSSSIEDAWDGSDSSGRPAPEGVYAYRLRLRFNDGRDEKIGGSVTLLR